MKKLISLFFWALVPITFALCQKQSIILTFTSLLNTQHVEGDSIWVRNNTRECDTMLYWPDTVLVLNPLGIEAGNPQRKDMFTLFQNYPNPVTDRASVQIFIPQHGMVELTVSDLLGRLHLSYSQDLDPGFHIYDFDPGHERFYLLTAKWKGEQRSISIINAGNHANKECKLSYNEFKNNQSHLKSTDDVNAFTFQLGDELIYVGHYGNIESGITDAPQSNQDYIFQFTAGLPCPDLPIVIYEGQTYHTIQVFSQCWLKENLNTGVMVTGGQLPNDNGIIEKYCYNNDTANCAAYGALYHWDEAMQFSTEEGSRGICPEGWHIPTRNDIYILDGAADTHYGIFDPFWFQYHVGYRGFDTGKHLKSASGWYNNSNGLDDLGFTFLPSGRWDHSGGFDSITAHGMIWVSYGESDVAMLFTVREGYDNSAFSGGYKNYGFSVRCIKDQLR